MKQAFRHSRDYPAALHQQMQNQFIDFLKKYGDIPPQDEQLIADAMQPKHFNEGDYLFKEGRICNELFFICNGVLQIAGITSQDNEVTYFFVAENHLCTIMLSFTNRVPATDSIMAGCNTDVLTIHYHTLQTLFAKLPYLQSLFQQIQQQAFMQKLALRNHYLSHEDATTRYKLFVSQMPSVARRVSLTSIASYLGITPQSLSRIRRSLK